MLGPVSHLGQCYSGQVQLMPNNFSEKKKNTLGPTIFRPTFLANVLFGPFPPSPGASFGPPPPDPSPLLFSPRTAQNFTIFSLSRPIFSFFLFRGLFSLNCGRGSRTWTTQIERLGFSPPFRPHPSTPDPRAQTPDHTSHKNGLKIWPDRKLAKSHIQYFTWPDLELA